MRGGQGLLRLTTRRLRAPRGLRRAQDPAEQRHPRTWKYRARSAVDSPLGEARATAREPLAAQRVRPLEHAEPRGRARARAREQCARRGAGAMRDHVREQCTRAGGSNARAREQCARANRSIARVPEHAARAHFLTARAQPRPPAAPPAPAAAPAPAARPGRDHACRANFSAIGVVTLSGCTPQ